MLRKYQSNALTQFQVILSIVVYSFFFFFDKKESIVVDSRMLWPIVLLFLS